MDWARVTDDGTGPVGHLEAGCGVGAVLAGWGRWCWPCGRCVPLEVLPPLRPPAPVDPGSRAAQAAAFGVACAYEGSAPFLAEMAARARTEGWWPTAAQTAAILLAAHHHPVA